MVQLTGGAFLTGYLLALGSSELVIGLVASLPLLFKISQLYTSWRIEQQGAWWTTALRGAMLGRLPFFIAAAIPFLPVDPSVALWMLVAVVAMSALGGSIYEIGFLTWMAELVPVRERGQFWGRLARVGEVAGVMVALTAAWLFDRWQMANPGSLDGYAMLFGTGAAAGAIALIFLRRVPVPAHATPLPRRVSFIAAMRRPASDRNFRRVLSFVATLGFGVGFLGPYTNVLMLREMGLPFLTVTAVNVIPSVMMVLLGSYWGRLSDHFGNRPVIRTASYLIALMPSLWILAAPGREWPLVAVQIVSGTGWAGYNIAMNNMVLKIAPSDARSSFVAAMGVAFAGAQAVSPIVAGLIFEALSGYGLRALVIFHVLFAISMAIRLIATPMLARVDEPGGRSVGDMIRVLGRFRSMGSSPAADMVFTYGYTHLARLADMITREHSATIAIEPRARRVRRKRRRAVRPIDS